jgi:anion-transporting  ArsA/GET3 family ATPase
VWELAQLERWDKHNRTYDLVVVDAPASGHGLAMLTAPRTYGEIARVGPIRRQAFKVRDMLADRRRTGYVAVALPEEMPVNETLELDTRLRDAVGRGLDAIVVNGLYPARFSAKEADALRAAADNGLAPESLAAVRAALAEHERARTQRSHLRRLKRDAEARVHTLPFLFDAEVGLDEYATLAAKLGRDLG